MSSEPQALTAAERDRAEADFRRLLWGLAGGIVLFLALVGLVGWLCYEPIVAFARAFVAEVGGFGVFLGFFVPDALTIFAAQDAFSAIGLLGGIPFWEVVCWATAGSLCGGSIAWWIGLRLSEHPRFQAWLSRRGARLRVLIERYGIAALAIAAVTPIPYSLGCYTAGAGGISFGRFFAISLVRFPRIAFYLWLVQLGTLSFSG